MARFILHLGVALITFVIGCGGNALVNQLGDRFISNRVIDFQATTGCPRPRSGSRWFNRSEPIVVGVDTDRKVYLGRVQRGSLDDTSLLRDQLTNRFQCQQQRRISGADSTANSATGEKAGQTVYVKVPPSVSFKDLGALLNAIKVTGADRIEIITDFSKTDYRSLGRRPFVRVLQLR
jgi:biopolymer transport protein ExbD